MSSFLHSLKTAVATVCVLFASAGYAQDIVIEDFESGKYKNWTITGNAFGNAPATGKFANQHPVSGYRGEHLVNTFFHGDKSTGDATSRPFKIQRNHISFLIGGGPHKETLGIELLIDGNRVRHSVGPESEKLVVRSWDVKDFRNKTATLRIFDNATGGWGHINIDHIVQTDELPKPRGLAEKVADYRKSASYMNEALRPQFHFTPEINWMNDPNGLVYYDGEYHLFHQYNPAGNSWGHMSWGHAVSKDLMSWEHLPLAIPEIDGVMAFSGSCVVDKNNTAGFAKGDLAESDASPIVAIYTGHGHGKQVQNLAYSNDKGRTWKIYDQNPVLDLGKAHFRDPKVFWHQPTKQWIMAVSLAVEKVIAFYGSTDLKNWDELSRFGPAGVTDKPNWECPDLFQLPVEDESDASNKKLWVLEADIGSGSIAGGSGGEYFVGDFDGTRFKTIQSSQWVDFGRDFYAPISWDNIPDSDGRRVWIGWFNNWETALVPTSPWRSCMSIPRTLSLRKVAFNNEEPATYVLVQRPVAEFDAMRGNPVAIDTSNIKWPPSQVVAANQISDLSFELATTLKPGQARSLGVRIRTGPNEFTEVGYDRNSAAVYVDRKKSGNVGFHKAFPGRHSAPTRIIDGQIELRIIVDRSSIEVFINDGEAVISDRIFPTSRNATIEAFAGDTSASITNTLLYHVKSVWRK